MFFIIFVAIIVGLAAYSTIIKTLNTKPKTNLHYPQKEKSHKFHEPVGEYENNHADRVGKHLIAHPEPEAGYVVLNGVKHRIEDCKNL